MKQEPQVSVRWLIRDDLPDVLRIEDESFGFPWSEEDFIRTLRQRNCIGMVAVDPPWAGSEAPLGFMIYELHKTRLHLLNLAVEPDCRRRGVGQALLAKLIGKLHPGRRTSILTEVRETNLAAQCFFRAQGFRAVRVLRDFFEDTTEDAYQFRYRPADSPKPRLACGGLFTNRISRFMQDNGSSS